MVYKVLQMDKLVPVVVLELTVLVVELLDMVDKDKTVVVVEDFLVMVVVEVDIQAVMHM